jgi:hypothetical protein
LRVHRGCVLIRVDTANDVFIDQKIVGYRVGQALNSGRLRGEPHVWIEKWQRNRALREGRLVVKGVPVVDS